MNIIDIPNEDLIGSRYCYNPSIIDWKGKTYMFYRHSVGRWETDIAVCELTADWKVVPKSNKKLKLPRLVSNNGTVDDPRAFVVGDKLYLMTCQGHLVTKGKDWIWTTALMLNQVTDLRTVSGNFSDAMVIPYGKNINLASNIRERPATEKNWTPFSGGDKLKFLYTINPLVVIDYEPKKKVVTELGKHEFDQKFWKKGSFLAGSTPLIPFEDGWLSFFHSYVQEDAFNRRRYFVGAFTLSKDGLKVTGMSRNPIMSAEMDPEHDLRHASAGWLPNVVFPCGLIQRGEKYYMSYGWQDCRCKVVEFEKDEILETLRSIKTC